MLKLHYSAEDSLESQQQRLSISSSSSKQKQQQHIVKQQQQFLYQTVLLKHDHLQNASTED